MKSAVFAIFLFLLACIGCGSAGMDSGKVLEGRLLQGVGGGHKLASSFKHGENEPIGEVEICALGVCSITDSRGDFSFGLPEEFKGGELLLSVVGHHTDASVVANFPKEVEILTLELRKISSSEVKIYEQSFEGQ